VVVDATNSHDSGTNRAATTCDVVNHAFLAALHEALSGTDGAVHDLSLSFGVATNLVDV
jgi:hypothetical protein